MSEDQNKDDYPPQYIVTTPSEADTREEQCLQESAQQHTTMSTTSKLVSQSIQKQTKRTTRTMALAASTSESIEAVLAESMLAEKTKAVATSSTQQQYQQLSENQHIHKQQQQSMAISQKGISTSNRSQSLQSGTLSEEHSRAVINVAGDSHTLSSTTAQLSQQLKAQSSTSITTSEHRSSSSSFVQKTSSSHSSSVQQQGSSGTTKAKFHSFLHQPEAGGHHTSTSGGFLTAHQKHVRQFVRSTSAHSEATTIGAGKEKCIRSASTQHDDSAESSDVVETGGLTISTSSTKLGHHQSSSVLLSKSAETIEMKSSSAGMRTQLTLSGGLLAPPNRKITILSPIQAPPGLHDMLKRTGRSPLSPRISFPFNEVDVFG